AVLRAARAALARGARAVAAAWAKAAILRAARAALARVARAVAARARAARAAGAARAAAAAAGAEVDFAAAPRHGAVGRVGDRVGRGDAPLDARLVRAAHHADAGLVHDDGQRERRVRHEAELAPRDDAALRTLDVGGPRRVGEAILRQHADAGDRL